MEVRYTLVYIYDYVRQSRQVASTREVTAFEGTVTVEINSRVKAQVISATFRALESGDLERREALERPCDLLRRARLRLVRHRLRHRLLQLRRARSLSLLHLLHRERHAVGRRQANLAPRRARQTAEGLEQRRPRGGRRRVEVAQLAVERHAQRGGVQRHAIEAVARGDLLGVGERAVPRVAEQVVAAHRTVLADLVRAPRAQLKI
mmetsp:Transcript_5154/g.10108  ORF Transcript_5154/g.10108 Transcript_5154/m.10108 type:complete len:206 (+) Transcript_5154:64-681(+)